MGIGKPKILIDKNGPESKRKKTGKKTGGRVYTLDNDFLSVKSVDPTFLRKTDKPSMLKFDQKLVLNQWILSLFEVSSFDQLRRERGRNQRV